jgi:hypothetical protein
MKQRDWMGVAANSRVTELSGVVRGFGSPGVNAYQFGGHTRLLYLENPLIYFGGRCRFRTCDPRLVRTKKAPSIGVQAVHARQTIGV